MLTLVKRLSEDYPELRFKPGKRFSFRPPRTINFVLSTGVDKSHEHNNYQLQLLHEVGHALSGHYDFTTEPERLKLEREAWEKARKLCSIYNIVYDEEFVEGALDTYRDWLHQRSKCRECGLTRYQTPDGVYHCPRCENFT